MTDTRVERLAVLLAGAELDALIVSAPANLFYLTGYSGSNGLAVVALDGQGRFLTDFRYQAQVANDLRGGLEVEIVSGELLDGLAPSLPVGRIGIDDAHLSVRQHARLAELAPAGAALIPAAGMVEELRLTKDVDELARIRAAAELIDGLYAWLIDRPLAGRTERDLAIELEHEMRRLGADGPSFPSIVASGAHGALPHAVPRPVQIQPGVLVTVDIGARLDGYCSDCTRTFAAARAPSGPAREIYDLVYQAQQVGLDALRAGQTGVAVDAAARAVIEAAGHGDQFGHGLGHGVGIEIHEAPRLSRQGADDSLRAGSVVTVEPGVYVPGELGVRIEDLVVVTSTGCEVLSHFTKNLLVV